MEPDESRAESDRIVIGYHGTSAERMADILRQGFKISQNDWDWLGHGVYFWEGHIRAREWADRKFGQQAAVIQAKIKLRVCLDLCDSGYLDVIRQAYERLKESYEKQGLPLPDNQGTRRIRDCLVFNYLATEIWPVDTVRSLFMEGEEIYPGTTIRTRQHIQLCVRNLDCILEVNRFLAR